MCVLVVVVGGGGGGAAAAAGEICIHVIFCYKSVVSRYWQSISKPCPYGIYII